MAASRDLLILRSRRRRITSEPFSLPGFNAGPRASETAITPRALDALADSELRKERLSDRDLPALAQEPDVLAVTPVMGIRLIEPVGAANVGAAGQASWGIGAVGADQTAFDGAGVKVAVLDTGIDAKHPAFAGVNLIQRNFTSSGPSDVQGHGTHCAGTIFGRDVSGTRIGIARGVTTALIAKVLDDQGRGDSSMLFDGMVWASEEGAQVISMSLGFDFPSMVAYLQDQGWPLEPAVSEALVAYRSNLRMFDAIMATIKARASFGPGCLVVAAAGNESDRPRYEIHASLPAAAQDVISVGAAEQQDQKLGIARFSNTLPNISAPGVAIVSAKAGGGLRSLSGTSMACPHVAGLAALWWQAIGSMPVPQTTESVLSRMLGGARSDVFGPGSDVADYGQGLARAPA